ncbi:MAG: hypothetical protein ACK4PR_09495 [Gammaproteobacteria bacterium]
MGNYGTAQINTDDYGLVSESEEETASIDERRIPFDGIDSSYSPTFFSQQEANIEQEARDRKAACLLWCVVGIVMGAALVVWATPVFYFLAGFGNDQTPNTPSPPARAPR